MSHLCDVMLKRCANKGYTWLQFSPKITVGCWTDDASDMHCSTAAITLESSLLTVTKIMSVAQVTPEQIEKAGKVAAWMYVEATMSSSSLGLFRFNYSLMLSNAKPSQVLSQHHNSGNYEGCLHMLFIVSHPDVSRLSLHRRRMLNVDNILNEASLFPHSLWSRFSLALRWCKMQTNVVYWGYAGVKVTVVWHILALQIYCSTKNVSLSK